MTLAKDEAPEPIGVLFAFLRVHVDPHVDDVEFIGAGWCSQAFAFRVGKQLFIVRLNAFVEDFYKDDWAHQHLNTPGLPVPRVTQIGRYDARRYYAISERCAGQDLNRLEIANVRSLVPQLFDALHAIHRADVSRCAGWGLTDRHGNGAWASWAEYLLALHNGKFAWHWPSLIATSFVERDVFVALYDEMQQLLAYASIEKSLVHGDYGFKNVMAEDARLTGVLDWAEMRLGDWLYDVAYLDFWSDEIPYGALWHEYAAAHGIAVPHFAERMRCYMLHLGLCEMLTSAALGNEADYVQARERTQAVLLPERRHSNGRAWHWV